ncbi:MAG: POTRA domain-containing protein [Myxococcaceae bacterium]
MSLLLCALLLTQAPVDPGTPIASVEVRVPAGADPRLLDRVQSLIVVRKGQPFSRRAVGRSIENLYATGKFSDIAALAQDAEGGVAIIFDATPRQSIGSVFVEGAHEVSRDDIIATTKLEPGLEYWPERLEAAADAVRSLYRRRGYREAKVRTDAVLVEGAITAGFVIDEGPAGHVRSVVISGEPGLPLPRVLEALGLRPGDVLDLTRVEAGVEALRTLLKREHYYRARVDAPEVSDDGVVLLPVVSGPHYELVFSGNRVVSDRGLRQLLAYDGEETLDLGLEDRLARKLERFYRFRGFHEAHVTASEVRKRGGEAALGFAIEEGEQVRVTSLTFEGAKEVSASDLRDLLRRVMEASRPEPSLTVHSLSDPTEVHGRGGGTLFAPFLPDPRGDAVLDEATWVEAAKAMTVSYRERGFLRATVRFAGAEVRGQQASGRFEISEGPRASFRFVEAQGLPKGFSSEVMGTINVGAPFSSAELDRLQKGLSRELGRAGYLYAEVEATSELDADGRQVDAVLKVLSGPQVKVRAVLPVGHVRTAESVITSQATMREGLPLDSESLFSTQANLNSLGLFRNVQVEMLNPERPEPLKTVVLRVREKQLWSAEPYIGYYVADGIRGGVEFAVTNIGGRGINIDGRAQANLFLTSVPALTGRIDVSDLDWWKRIGFRLNAGIDLKSVMPAGLGLRLDLVGERVFRQQFRFTRFAGLPTLDWSHTFPSTSIEWLRPKISFALQYEAEYSSVETGGSALSFIPQLSLADQERLRFLAGDFVLQSARISSTLDLRDSALTPRRGLLIQASGELTGALFARDEKNQPVTVNFAKVSGLASGYIPFGEKVVFAVSVRAGRIFGLEAGSITPPVRRFFLGGATSVRGFNEDQLIAEDVRAVYRQQVRDCQVLASKQGCASAANTILSGLQVPSQGGELFAVGKAELRFPLVSVFELGAFFEAGNLWLSAPDVLVFRPVAGGGVRWVTPIGPLALDVGFNLTPDTVINEPRFVVHFNIGVF